MDMVIWYVWAVVDVLIDEEVVVECNIVVVV